MTSSLQRGYAAAQARNPVEAAEWFEKALQEDPQDGRAMSFLGQALCSIGRREEGISYLRQAGQHFLAIAQKSGDIGKVLEITQQLQHWSDFPGALELGKQATRVSSSDVRVFQLLALTHAQLNQKKEALEAGRQALSLAPENTMMQVLQGSLEADAGLNDDAKCHLEKVLTLQLNAREAFRAHKELARVLDKLGAYDEVFPHLHASAGLSRSLPEVQQQDMTMVPTMLKANKAGFDRELLGRWAEAEFPHDQPAPTFLIGFLRSGTTLTQEVLGAHPDAFVADEADFIWAVQRELHQMDSSSTSTADKLRNLDLRDIIRLRDSYWKRVRGRFGNSLGQRMLVDKFTMNTIDLGLINCIFPDAKVVFVMRDPRDVCLSCFMQLMVPTPTTIHLLSWNETAEFYTQIMDWWAHIKQQMTLASVEFRYEDAVEKFEPTFRKVFDFLGLSWDPAVVDFHKHAAKKFIASPSRNQVAQPLYSSSVARWRHYEVEFAPILPALRPYIEYFGYANSSSDDPRRSG